MSNQQVRDNQQPRLPQLIGYLRNKALLLLFDNIEHLLPDAVEGLLQILQCNAALYALVTSRRLLNLHAEFGWQVTGLPLPEQADTSSTLARLLTYSSIALFDDRARCSNHTFRITAQNQAAVVAICRLVAGLPLAIELAAALTKYYTCAQIYAALQRDYTILTTTLRDLPPRHRSMKAVFDDSWRCLSQTEAQALAVCSLFATDFTQEAATAAGIKMTTLATLVDHSLLQARNGRFSMHKLTRQYVASRLTQ